MPTKHPHFSADYSEARRKFISACSAARLPVKSLANPRLGPDGEPLYTDYVSIGPGIAERVLIVNSATHGVEGFCGSAAVIAWLRTKNHQALPSGMKIVLLHALNPYGFAWLRRVNENNVDLNRNFISRHAVLPDNAEYEAFHSIFLPKHWNDKVSGNIQDKLWEFADVNGVLSMQAAVCRGQYHRPNGVFFGGESAAWSHHVFKEIVRSNCKLAKHVVLLDFHTGLGAYGQPELICSRQLGEDVKNWFTDRMTCAELGDAVGPSLFGTIGQGLRQVVHEGAVYSITAEFGTFDVYRVLMAVIADNWLHLFGDLKSSLGADMKREVRQSFYPDEDDWCEQVLKGSQRILSQAIEGLAKL